MLLLEAACKFYMYHAAVLNPVEEVRELFRTLDGIHQDCITSTQ
jgi:hypothetical protein